MIYFTKPWGSTNPAGFGGTVVNGDLIQVGGLQNTIRNTPDYAPDPIGPVIIGVAQPSVCGPTIIVTGGLVAPFEDGTYTLALKNLFANVIREGEDGSGAFWVTEAAMSGTVQNLTITVTQLGACCTPAGSCTVDDETGCVNAAGTFYGVATLCDADSDADGVSDACDRCPDTPAGSEVGDHGCDRPRAPHRVHDIR